MQPKVTIILPIYNVEPYLRQCLDSVVNQTMQEIQIICVNDGSTDSSPAILEEYADRDSRITIIHQENQGGGSARNAAYPYVKGKYTYFADPDDWLDLTLCEKAARRIEETDADVVYFRGFRERFGGRSRPTHKFDSTLPDVRVTPGNCTDLIRFCQAPWLKFWKSEYLLGHQIRFSEGKRPHNDVFQNWKGCILARRIAILDEILYHNRRSRPGSYQTTLDQSHFVIVDTMNEIGTWLRESGNYEEYRNIFLSSKLDNFRRKYIALPNQYRPAFRELVLNALSEEDRHFLRSSCKRKVQAFYRMLKRQGLVETSMFWCAAELARFRFRFIYQWIVRPFQRLQTNG